MLGQRSDNGEFGAVKTLTLERTPQTLSALKENKAVNIIETLNPIGNIS